MSGWQEWRGRLGGALRALRGAPDAAADPPDADGGEPSAGLTERGTNLLITLEAARTDNQIRLAYARALATSLRLLIGGGAVACATYAGGGWALVLSVCGASLLAAFCVFMGRRIRRAVSDGAARGDDRERDGRGRDGRA
ncbi:hypothetical protein GCM10009801_40440 [Streptomyces albiaxialis]|uniref:DUF202 domain-containing protein n=1 Tax=Streptomyces albiaxialis TaxID=329523 RepID=A0ABP5HLQ6_9ACTN